MLNSLRVSLKDRWFRLLTVLAALCFTGGQAQVVAANDASALVARVLATNNPWLNPAPAVGTYRLRRQPDGEPDHVTGPFSFENVASNGWQFCHPNRVGSMVWTPLHTMALGQTPYTLGPLGSTNFNGLHLATAEVTFDAQVRGSVGMGGQADTSYSRASYPVWAARLLIDASNAVPILIQSMANPTNRLQFIATWQFDPLFFRVAGGRAPRAFDWNEPSTFHERQEFQVVQDTWMFKRGDAWWPTTPSYGIDYSGHIQTLEMVDLSLGLAMPLGLSRLGTHLSISAPESEVTGFAVEAADNLKGPWSLVKSEMSSDGSSLIVTMPTNTFRQFYRLTK